MGRYLSWRSAIGSVFYLGTFIIMGIILDNSINIGYWNFVIITMLAASASLASSILYLKIRQPKVKSTATQQKPFGFVTFLKETRHNHLGTFIIFMSLFSFSVNLSSPLLAAYMISNLSSGHMTYTMMVSCEYIARILSLSFWGKQIDRSGSLSLMMKVAYLIPFVPILWIFSKNLLYLGAVQVFSGIVWAAFDLCAQAFIFKATPPEHRLRYISYQRSLTTFAVAIGALSGAFMLDFIFPVFGSQILGVFLVSGILRLVVARVMLPRLQPGAIPDAIIHEELAIELAKLNMVNREGLYYHPEKWSQLAKPISIFGTIIGKTVNKLSIPRPKGLYYNPQNWSNYLGQNTTLQPIAFQDVDAEVVKGGLYHDKKAWSTYMQQTAVPTNIEVKTNREGLINNPVAMADVINKTPQIEKIAPHGSKPSRKGLLYDRDAWTNFTKQAIVAEAKTIDDAKITRHGIFYDSQKWGEYLKQSLVLNATTTKNGDNSLTNRQAIFYHPEIWANYKNHASLSNVAYIKSNTSKTANRRQLLYHPEEWEKMFDPAMVHIGRKSAIGTVINKQRQVNNLKREITPVSYQTPLRQAMPIKRIKIVPVPV
jgi:hypothetical protein